MKLKAHDDAVFRGVLQHRDWVRVYDCNQLMLVPHYTKPNVFVAPCNIEFTEQELIDAGAIKSISYLWPREWAKEMTT